MLNNNEDILVESNSINNSYNYSSDENNDKYNFLSDEEYKITNYKGNPKLSNNDFNNSYEKFSNLKLNNNKNIDLKSNNNII